ncbi:alpha/beta hydrolase [Carnobacterium viridans]|nr:alpha/beta hydrolase [Carnobacterium viridans]
MGSGKKIILFIHGFASSQQTWQWITPAFERTHTLILVDLVGSGNSDLQAYKEERYSSLMGHADDLIALCDALELQEITIFGHSVGGTIGLLLAKKRPDLVQQVIMIGASPRYLNDLPSYHGGFEREDVAQILEMMELNYVGWASHLSSVALPASEGESQTKYVEASFLSSNPKVTYQFLEMTLLVDYRDILKEVTTDTVIIQCSDDSFVPIEVAEYMVNEIKGSTLHILSSKGHYPHVSNPEETVKAIKLSLK